MADRIDARGCTVVPASWIPNTIVSPAIDARRGSVARRGIVPAIAGDGVG